MNLISNIDGTANDYIEIVMSLSNALSPVKSQIGNLYSFPFFKDIPADQNGDPMFFLAQVNFEEIPHFCGLPDKGILQFYISYKNLIDPNTTEDFAIKLIAREDIDLMRLIKYPPKKLKHYPLFITPYHFNFHKRKMSVPVSENGFNDVYDEIFASREQIMEFEKEYFNRYARNSHHQIGGLPIVMKRSSKREFSLLQLALGNSIEFGGALNIIFLAQDTNISPENIKDIECQIFWH
ncbi:MAG: DUF1963 domain-containing protein [Candidatus Paracaedibacteraceae bacterium]|nr:DUF1963 domain-containing protein [Candidatus Paracaedibacteraceae bacterium]